jgi:hypothetical protein
VQGPFTAFDNRLWLPGSLISRAVLPRFAYSPATGRVGFFFALPAFDALRFPGRPRWRKTSGLCRIESITFSYSSTLKVGISFTTSENSSSFSQSHESIGSISTVIV